MKHKKTLQSMPAMYIERQASNDTFVIIIKGSQMTNPLTEEAAINCYNGLREDRSFPMPDGSREYLDCQIAKVFQSNRFLYGLSLD